MLGTRGFDSLWPCTFNVVCAHFAVLGMRKLPNVNVVSGGIQPFKLISMQRVMCCWFHVKCK